MDIFEMLNNDINDLLDDDLSMLEEELTTGGYDAPYRKDCLKLIADEQAKRRQFSAKASAIAEGTPQVVLPSEVSRTVLASPETLSPFNEVEVKEKSPFELVSSDVTVLRKAEKYKTLFKEYLRTTDNITEELLDKHLSFFNEWEMGAIMRSMRLSEGFLDKYFASLDHAVLAKTQLFSEDFYMRHFAELDPNLVLAKGKNPWRKKENRSTKLDMFLRIKGVRL